MKISSVSLRSYKRFTHLVIDEIPETARLVVLIGPNGTGKSSIFDAFLLKCQGAVSNHRLDGKRGDYYLKDDKASQQPSTTQEVWNLIDN